METTDDVIRFSLISMLYQHDGLSEDLCHQLIQLAEGIENTSVPHCGILCFKTKALRILGFFEAAREVVEDALRGDIPLPSELVLALRYEYMLILEGLGLHREHYIQLTYIYSLCPDYEDVSARLGISSQISA